MSIYTYLYHLYSIISITHALIFISICSCQPFTTPYVPEYNNVHNIFPKMVNNLNIAVSTSETRNAATDSTFTDNFTVELPSEMTHLETSNNLKLTSQNHSQSEHKEFLKEFKSEFNQTMNSTEITSPFLNYIFDSYAPRKHHHKNGFGPRFDENQPGEDLVNVSVAVGNDAFLDCKISFLQDKVVSWVKNETSNNMQLLTIGSETYSSDKRFNVNFQRPNNWRLKIINATQSDDGIYQCQISTHPTKIIRTYLQVQTPEIFIVDEYGAPVIDKYYQNNSAIELLCMVRNVPTSAVYWLHGSTVLNYDDTRGGISVKTDFMQLGANSTLSLSKLTQYDSGNYTCSTGPNLYVTVTIHVLNGDENLAELHHQNSCKTFNSSSILLVIFVMGAVRVEIQNV